MVKWIIVLVIIGLAFGGWYWYTQFYMPKHTQTMVKEEFEKYPSIILAGGCFWCTEGEYNHTGGIVAAISGYVGGNVVNPTYEQVSAGTTGHREAVRVYYDPTKVTLEKLLDIYWRHMDPTDAGGSFNDRGYQYTSAIYYTAPGDRAIVEQSKVELEALGKYQKPIVTEILPFTPGNFYPAEEYHQDYSDKNPTRYQYYRSGSGRNDYICQTWECDTTGHAKLPTRDMTVTPNSVKPKIMDTLKDFRKPSADELKKELTPLQYEVTQEEGTERPFDNEYNGNKETGIYVDRVSGEPLFLSTYKYDSGTGWPSFTQPISPEAVELKVDNGLFTTRTEVRSKVADSHLGHVFPDGPADAGGQRYCMNSAALRFIPLADMEREGYGDYVNQLQK